MSIDVRRQVTARAFERCEYCQSPVRYATQAFSVEHIIPRARGGQATLENLAFACQGCNNHKYNKIEVFDVISGKMAALYNPRTDRWAHHFAWSNDLLLMVGMSPTGRVTVTTLFLNRVGVVNLRRRLLMIDEHPPTWRA